MITMKTVNWIAISILFVFYSCNSGVKTTTQKVTFGIYETLKTNEIPASVIDTLRTMNIELEKDPQQSVIGYILKADSMVIQFDLSKENFSLVKTRYPLDHEGKYYAVVAIKPNPAIDISDVKNTRVKGKNVEIYFNMNGSRKWADLTKKRIGNSIAFIIDGKIYAMPVVNGEIRSGIALINGIEDEMMAKNISESLNSCISE
jgi:preprotein translocase subunit SecD